MAGIDFFNKVAALAEDEGHHPDLHLEGYRNLSIAIWTHAAGGLTENDFILAAKIDQIPVKLEEVTALHPQPPAKPAPEAARRDAGAAGGAELSRDSLVLQADGMVVAGDGSTCVGSDCKAFRWASKSALVAPFSVRSSLPGFSFKPASAVRRTDRPGFDPFKSRWTHAHDSR